MARPQKQTVDYFPHDANASNSDTLAILEGYFGNDGYAFWFKLLEKLSTSENHIIDCRNSRKWQLLLAKAHLTEEKGEEIMRVLVELDAIDVELWQTQKTIWCQKFVDGVADAYKNRRRPVPTRPVITKENPVSTDEKPQTKLKETKLNKREKPLKQKFGEFLNVFLTAEEYGKLVKKFGVEDANDQIERLGAYLKSIGKPQKYEDHYATILNWARREGGKSGTLKQAPPLPTNYKDPEQHRQAYHNEVGA